MNQTDFIKKITDDKNRAKNNPDKPIKICAGLYYLYHGELFIIEYVTKNDGFSLNEWHYGTENDPHADQCAAKKDCIKGILSL